MVLLPWYQLTVPSARTRSTGYRVVLGGAVGFIISCFVPFSDLGYNLPDGPKVMSMFQTQVIHPFPGGNRFVSLLNLFAGATVIILVTTVALRGRRAAFGYVAVGASVVIWAVPWTHWLFTAPAFSKVSIGYWCLAASVVVTVAGAVIACLPTHEQDTVDFLAWSHKANLRRDVDIEDLLSRAGAGDVSAQDQLIKGNAELAGLLALRLRPSWLREPDAMQEGIIVLTNLVESGDRDLFTKLGPAIDSVFKGMHPGPPTPEDFAAAQGRLIEEIKNRSPGVE